MDILGIFKKKDRLNALAVNGVGGAAIACLDMVEGKRYAANDVTCEAWMADEGNTFIDRATGRRCQLISAWSNCPIKVFGKARGKLTKENRNALAARVTDEEITWKDDDRKKKGNSHLFTGIIAVILAITVAIPMLIQACR